MVCWAVDPKYPVSDSNVANTVGPAPGRHRPFSSASRPRQSRYHALRAAGSAARRKYPPMPSTRSMPLSCQDGDPAGWHHTIAAFAARLNRGGNSSGADRRLGTGSPHDQTDQQAEEEAEDVCHVGHAAATGGEAERVGPLQHEPQAENDPRGDSQRDEEQEWHQAP